MKLTPTSFRKGVNWIFLLLLYHFVAFLAYSFLVTNIVHSLVGLDGKSSAAYGVLVAFQCLYWLIVAFWAIFRGQMSYADVRRNIPHLKKKAFPLYNIFIKPL